MAGQGTYYLVDFENVGEGGIKISGKLPSTDFVYLFNTKGSAKVNMSVLANHDLSNLTIFDVPQGSQSVDKHLLAYLGYLIGRHGNKARYVIVSKDTGYDAIAAFWKKDQGVNICRQSAIQTSSSAKKVPMKQAGSSVKNIDSGSKTKDLSKKKAELNAAIMKAFSNSRYDNCARGKAVSLAVKYYVRADRKGLTHDALVRQFGQADGSDIYNRIKRLL